MIRLYTCAIILAVGGTLPLGAAERMTMTVSPIQSFAPSDIVVLVHVAPDAANRAVVIVADSGDYYRSSVVPLDGERRPGMVVMELRSVPAGDYEIRAVVVDAAGHELGSVRKQAIVVSDSGQ
jgi:hypothetical protein